MSLKPPKLLPKEVRKGVRCCFYPKTRWIAPTRKAEARFECFCPGCKFVVKDGYRGLNGIEAWNAAMRDRWYRLTAMRLGVEPETLWQPPQGENNAGN